MPEPPILGRGKKFHDVVERFYTFESKFNHETKIMKASGRGGRMDLFLRVEADWSYVVVIEAKNTDWDVLATRGTVKRNLASHRRQVWNYLEGVLSYYDVNGVKRTVDLCTLERSAGLVYPRVPHTRGLKEEIENYLGEWGISIVWFDEAPPPGTPARRAWDLLQSNLLPAVSRSRS